MGRELGAVVVADEVRCTSLENGLVEHVDGSVGVDRVGDQIAQRLPGELVGDVQEL
jgi:hypothetical protein